MNWFPGVESLVTAPNLERERKRLSSCVYVLDKTSHQEISRPEVVQWRQRDVPKCRVAELLLLFLTFSLPSPSSLLKLPISGGSFAKTLYSSANVKSINNIENINYKELSTPRIKANIVLIAVMEDESAVSDGLQWRFAHLQKICI